MADPQPQFQRTLWPLHTEDADLGLLNPPQLPRTRRCEICPAIRDLALDAQPLACLDCANRTQGTEARLACIERARLFRRISPLNSISIACQARERYIPRHQMLFRQGEPGRYVFLIASGRVKITQLGPAGDEVIVWLKGPGEMIGGLGLPPGTANDCGAETIEPCHIVYWDARVLKSLSDRSTLLQRNTVINLVACLEGLQTRFCELATEKVALRLARTLVRLHESATQGPGEQRRINLSREELAQMTGTTLFAVSRLLSEWTQLGIIDARREAVLVHDALRLLDFAREECTPRSSR